MGRRWWQKEARRSQNEQTINNTSEEANDISALSESIALEEDLASQADHTHLEDRSEESSEDHVKAVEDAETHLDQPADLSDDEEHAEEVLNEDEAAVENSLDTAADVVSEFKIITRSNNLPQNYGRNKKKKR